uniref:NmrA-like domain-containing protein n=1 Tax=Manihot esculenta TaxID=3983 RepID=A0A2C9U6P6_MANES
MGVTIVHGELNEHEKIVALLRQVDVVISALAYPQVLDQLKIIDAIKVAGNIKRFFPSDFGIEEDRVTPLPPFEAVLEKKRKIRRAIEAAGIPSCLFLQIALLLILSITCFVHVRRDMMLMSMVAAKQRLELISLWEKKTGQSLNRVHISEKQIVELSETLPHPQNIPVAILHSLFIKGDLMSYELNEDDLEASKLYPDFEYTTVVRLLDVFLVNPPELALAAFE